MKAWLRRRPVTFWWHVGTTGVLLVLHGIGIAGNLILEERRAVECDRWLADQGWKVLRADRRRARASDKPSAAEAFSEG